MHTLAATYQVTELGLKVSKVLKSEALPLSSSKSQPLVLQWQEQSKCLPLLLEKQQNGGSTSQNLVNRKYSTFLGGLCWPQTPLDLYPVREKASTLINTFCLHGSSNTTTGQKTGVSNQK